MARFILGCPSHLEVDHVNSNGLDNRRNNLRICTRIQNNQNRRPFKGFKGVTLWQDKKNCRKAWRARITVNKKNKMLGYFATPAEAAKAYNAAAKKYHGQFARLDVF